MDELNQNSTPNAEINNSSNETEEPKGPTIGIVIIILILILGGVYVFMSRNDNVIPDDGTTIDGDLSEQSTSTELSDIETDAMNTDLSDIERELEDIEAELEAESNVN